MKEGLRQTLFDLGLNLESPDIQRWADEEGWTEVMDAAARQDSGWDSDEDGGKRQNGENIQESATRRLERGVRQRKKRAASCSIRNVKQGIELDFHDLGIQTRWPWSLHWSLEDALFTKRLFATTIKEI